MNLPCHLVVVKGTEFFDAKQGRYVDFPVTDVLQMMGRAGRPQFDDTGVACVFVHEPKKTFYRKFLHEPFPVESSLQFQLHEHFNAEVASGTVTSVRDCVEYLTWTYYFRRLVMNPSYYGLQDSSPAGVQQHLTALSAAVVRDLHAHDCVTVDEEQDLLPTALGRIASYYYLHYRTVGLVKRRFEQIVEETAPESCVQQVVRILCDAYEFSELPVRHNEDELNRDMAADLPWPTAHMPMESPHTKAFLLLQAHFGRSALPISDYVNDTKSVLDQVPRVLNAMLDIAAEMSRELIVLALAKVSQMVVQGLWADSSELLQLPQVTVEIADRMAEQSVRTLRDAVSLTPEAAKVLFQNCTSQAKSSKGEAAQFLTALADLPCVSVAAARLRCLSQPMSDEVDLLAHSAPVGLVGEAAYELDCELLRSSRGVSLFTPRYSKGKSPSWWVVLVMASRDDRHSRVLLVKKIGAIAAKQVVKISLPFTVLQSEATGGHLTMHVMCDSVVGLDLRLDFPVSATA